MSATPKGYAKHQPDGFKNCIDRVAVVGAGGQIGQYITKHLLATGKHDVTAITRLNSASKLPDGIKVARVNYTSEAEGDFTALVEVLRGQQVLLITMSHQSHAATKNLVHAASVAEVAYVLPNWFGHDANNKKLIEDSLMTRLFDNVKEIEKLGVSSYFLLVCNFWYEFSLAGGTNRYGFDFKNRSLTWYNDGNVAINTSTWPRCGQAIANLLSLKQLPDDENDNSVTISQFRDQCVYVSSFRVSQRDMFESVKRVTVTSEADWTITHENTEQRYKEGLEKAKKGDPEGWKKMGYSRMFFPGGGGDYEATRGLHNEMLGLQAEDLDEYTAIAVRLGENDEIPY